MHKISSKLTEAFNLGCDTDLEHSNPTFSLDTSLLMMIYTQIESGCKIFTGLELINDIVETITFWLYKPTLWPWSWKQNPIFSHDILAHGGAPQYQFGYKRLLTNTQPNGNKYMSWALQPSPLKTPQCFPFSSKIIHHTQRKKRSNVAAASQLMWTGTLW